jgi:hypothetical protein
LQTNDSGYVFAGFTSSFGQGGNDFYVVRTDPEGDTLWTKTFGSSGDDVARSILQTIDSGYVVAGYSIGWDTSIYIVKIPPDSLMPCCIGIRGDVNMDSMGPNVSDLTRLIAYIKNIEPTLPCFEEADVNGDTEVNATDVTYQAAYIRGIGPAPPACP